MIDAVVAPFLFILAVLGAAALAVRFFGAVTRVLLSTAEATAAETVARSSARRGDLTRMQQGQRVEERARGERGRALGAAIVWLLWLGVPLAFDLVPAAYAMAAPLWLIPRRRVGPEPGTSNAEPS